MKTETKGSRSTEMEIEEKVRPRWIEVNLDAVGRNTRRVKEMIGDGVKLLAVVKGDAYGLGMVPVAHTVISQGADLLGVTNPDEGVILRNKGIDAPIFIFRPLLPGEEELVVNYQLISSISSLQQAERLSDKARIYGVKVPVHLKVETGLGRTGFLPSSIKEHADRLFSLPGLEWEGIYTHFASAAGDPQFTRQQFRLFQSVVEGLKKRGIQFPLCHVCNSAAALLYPEMRLDLVRIGTLLYGENPPGVKDDLGLESTWSFWSRVIHLQKLEKGMMVGYGRTHRVSRDTTMAVIPVGYRDGFGVDVTPRPAGLIDLTKVVAKIVLGYLGFPVGKYYVEINGTPAPVLGRVGMELTCIDVGKIPGIEVGTPVRLMARRTVIRESIPKSYCQQEKAGSSDTQPV
ncbi:MAG: alanine racemase [Thermacetogeniaceae bacterium]|jgi:alanine racemase|nr:alanine racemase [Syntrophomonadaceae bacterium]